MEWNLKRIFFPNRSSVCDRPRTYDKFYQRTPGNFFDPTHVDSAISVCSSEEEVDGYDRTTKKDKKKKKRTKDVSRSDPNYDFLVFKGDLYFRECPGKD